MASVQGKRKRSELHQPPKKAKKFAFDAPAKGEILNGANGDELRNTSSATLENAPRSTGQPASPGPVAIHIVTGSYDRVLHGITATLPVERPLDDRSDASGNGVTFITTFLFAAHASPIRCLAISPRAGNGKRLLATGSADERINVYSISSAPPPPPPSSTSKSLIPDPANSTDASRNKPVGTLLHHDRPVCCLAFPSRGKLFSGAEDSTMAIVRARDWTVLSTIKAPIPKPQGRPSGDTAAPGEVPAGINSFAVHPSQKLMLSTGRRERCMRLWNLMTGKKAGVLNFDRSLLLQVGEGKHGGGEARWVRWDAAGEKFVIGFERGCALFGIDSRPKAIFKPSPPTKLHQMAFLPSEAGPDAADVLALSTEDGRIVFVDTKLPDHEPAAADLPACRCFAQLGGSAAGISGRVKDFAIISIPAAESAPSRLVIITGGSDGTIRVWSTSVQEITQAAVVEQTNGSRLSASEKTNGNAKVVPQIGTLLGTLETNNRITCLGAFLMDGQAAAAALSSNGVPDG